jgi:hypothetical protein
VDLIAEAPLRSDAATSDFFNRIGQNGTCWHVRPESVLSPTPDIVQHSRER